MIESALTVVACVLAISQPIPQVTRLLRSPTVAGVSGPTTWLGLVINAAWAAYGVGRSLVPVVLISVPYVLGYLAIGVLLFRGGNREGGAVAFAVAVGLAALTVVAGWPLLGTVLAVAVGIQFLPQVMQAWRAHDLSALAPGTYVVCALDGLIWGGFGLLVLDGPLMLYGSIMLTVAVLVLVPRARWSRRISPVGVG